MMIEEGRVVEIHYTLRNDAGEEIDSSDEDEALMYLHGSGQIVPGLEKALEGHSAGEKLSVQVSPEEGYGVRHENRVLRVKRSDLPDGPDPEVGMELEAADEDGQHVLLWVSAVDGSNITLDGNHPLAGQTLHFEVVIHTVRDATDDEKVHGHAHGPDGHHH